MRKMVITSSPVSPTISSAEKAFHGGPLPFITIADDGTCRVDEYAANILSQIDGKIAVISVAGLYRTGKSYLMNRLLGLPSGFELGGSVNPCTKGIWVWGQPVALADGFYAILIDTEGLGSSQRSQAVDLQILALSLLLSSYFIFNQIGPITEEALDTLAVVVNIARQVSEDIDLPSFLWVLRDFGLRLVDERGDSVAPRDYLEQCLASQAGISESVHQKNAVRETIKNLFPDRDCAILGRPVDSENDLRNMGKLPFESLRPQFRTQMDNFIKKVYTSLKPKEVNNTSLTGAMFAQLATSFCNSITPSSIPSVQPAWGQVITQQLRVSAKEAISVYRQLMTSEAINKLPLSERDLTIIHKKAIDQALLVFNRPNIHTNDSRFIVAQKDMLNKIEQLFENAKEDNYRVSEDLCLKLIKDLQAKFIGHNVQFSALIDAWKQLISTYEKQAPGPASYKVLAKELPGQLFASSETIWKTKATEDSRTRHAEVLAPVETEAKVLKGNMRKDVEIVSQESGSLEIASLKEVIMGSLSELKSAESSRKFLQFKAEAEEHLVNMEGRFNAGLAEAKRKNDMAIDSLRQTYEMEVFSGKEENKKLKFKISEIQNSSSRAIIENEKLKSQLEAAENEKQLRNQNAQVLVRMSELIISHLRAGGNQTLLNEFEKLHTAAINHSKTRPVQKPGDIILN